MLAFAIRRSTSPLTNFSQKAIDIFGKYDIIVTKNEYNNHRCIFSCFCIKHDEMLFSTKVRNRYEQKI